MKWIRLFSVAALVIAVDQITKAWADWAGWVELNSGISFNWLGESSPVVLGIFIAVVLFILTALTISHRETHFAPWLFLVIAAGLSNQIDRIFWGGVRDWILLPGLDLKNNIADWVIALSLIALTLKIIPHHVKSNEA